MLQCPDGKRRGFEKAESIRRKMTRAQERCGSREEKEGGVFDYCDASDRSSRGFAKQYPSDGGKLRCKINIERATDQMVSSDNQSMEFELICCLILLLQFARTVESSPMI